MSEFDEARRAAFVTDVVRFVRGLPRDLLPFDEVRDKLRLRSIIERGMQEVPLERIVGSLARKREFNRLFMPRDEELRDRWQEVHGRAEGPEGYIPVELYKVGDVYFVLDGHHRISVARAVGAPTIEAEVREFSSDVPISPEDSMEKIILRRARADFLDATGLTASEDEYEVSDVDGYERLLDHITVHRYYLGLDPLGSTDWPSAVESWRTNVYEPMIAIIRQAGALEQFPGRRETDLYLYAMDHLYYLREESEAADASAAVKAIQRSRRFLARVRRLFAKRRGPGRTLPVSGDPLPRPAARRRKRGGRG